VRKISSPQRVASVSNLYHSRSLGARNMGYGECCSGFGKRVCPFIPGKSSMTRGPTGSLELHGRRGSRKDPKYPRRIWLEKRWDRGEKDEGRLEVR